MLILIENPETKQVFKATIKNVEFELLVSLIKDRIDKKDMKVITEKL